MPPDTTGRSTWVLLRGLAREQGHWGPFKDELAAALTGDDVLAVDLPGTGEYRDVTSPTTLTGIADFVRDRVRERIGDPDGVKIRLITISLGSMVAFEWLRARPEELDGCVVINTSLASLSPAHQRLRWQVWPRFLRALVIPGPRERERAVIDLLINDPGAQARALNAWAKIATERPIGYRTLTNQLWAASRTGGERPVVNDVPGLILSGLGDRLVDPSCSTALAQATRWPLARHAWAGHDLPWDDGAWVIARILEWRGQLGF